MAKLELDCWDSAITALLVVSNTCLQSPQPHLRSVQRAACPWQGRWFPPGQIPQGHALVLFLRNWRGSGTRACEVCLHNTKLKAPL
jgi:hypothetical protein